MKGKRMESENTELLKYIDRIHTTKMGLERIRKNLELHNEDVIEYCKAMIKHRHCLVSRKGKNYYAIYQNCIITINASSYTIITAHMAG